MTIPSQMLSKPRGVNCIEGLHAVADISFQFLPSPLPFLPFPIPLAVLVSTRMGRLQR